MLYIFEWFNRGGIGIMDIREIEKVVDSYHINHPVFSGTKEQVMFELLSSFEDICSLSALDAPFNLSSLRNITTYMDALNQALHWVENSDLPSSCEHINTDILEERYEHCVSFLLDYALPYSVICSGYISFSRGRLEVDINGNTVTFNYPINNNKSEWADILREVSQNTFSGFIDSIEPLKLKEAISKLNSAIFLEDDHLCYTLSNDILEPFIEIANTQWSATKTLPDVWTFDLFSLDDYRKVWVNITALCYIHFFSTSFIADPRIRIKNNSILLPFNKLIDSIASLSCLNSEAVEKILRYITFEPSKPNVDIMYQPIVVLGSNNVIITPMLFLGSSPERNLLAVVSSRHDKEHSKEVNDLEELMVSELEAEIPQALSLKTVKHKKLSKMLPDLDFGLVDTVSNIAILCELKWFSAADSTKEVYAREDEITHGCDQAEAVLVYAMSDRKHFFKQVFNIDDGENIDVICCVIAKHNIRTQHKYVPVIDLNKFKKLISSKSFDVTFNTIRYHEFEDALPKGAYITHQPINYAGFNFKIPAICFESIDTL